MQAAQNSELPEDGRYLGPKHVAAMINQQKRYTTII